MKEHRRYMNKRDAIRFPTKVQGTKPVLIEQRVIHLLAVLVWMLLAWPLAGADKYTSSKRYTRAKHMESVDVFIWMSAFIAQLAWVILGAIGIASLFVSNGGQ